MNQTEYKHELIMPNDSIPVKIFSFSAHNDLRIIPSHWHRSAEILYVRRGKLNIWMNKRKYELNRNDFIYINSKEVHSTQSPEDNEVIVLQIPGDFLKTFSNNESLYIHCNTLELKDNKIFSAMRELLFQMYIYSERKDDAYYLKVYSLLFELGYLLVKNFRVKEENIDIVVYGHSHKSNIYEDKGILYINPGSVGPRRFNLPISMAKLKILDNERYYDSLKLIDKNIYRYKCYEVEFIPIVI